MRSRPIFTLERLRLCCGAVVLLLCLLAAASLAAAAEATGPPAVEVHGWMLTRYYSDVTVNDTRSSSGVISNEQDESRLKWERVSLSGLVRLANGKTGYAEIYIHPWLPNDDPSFLYLESFYLDVPAGPGAKFRIGKGRSNCFGIVPAYGIRKTSNYSPLSEAFTMDRVLGIQYLRKHGKDELAFGILNAERPGQRFIGMTADMQLDQGSLARTTVGHLTDRDTPADRSGQLQASARLGRQMGDMNVGVSGRTYGLDRTDVAFLAKKFATYNGQNRTARRYGLDATYNRMPFIGSAQYYVGDTGGIRNNGWEILLGVEPSAQCTAPWRSFSSACKGLFLRYGRLDIDVPRTLDSITWDTEQLAVSYVYPLRVKHFLGSLPKWLQIEYERNKEKPPAGMSEIPDNVFFVELFSAF